MRGERTQGARDAGNSRRGPLVHNGRHEVTPRREREGRNEWPELEVYTPRGHTGTAGSSHRTGSPRKKTRAFSVKMKGSGQRSTSKFEFFTFLARLENPSLTKVRASRASSR